MIGSRARRQPDSRRVRASDTARRALHIIGLNAGAAIYVSGRADSLAAGVDAARAAIADGKAAQVLDNLVARTNA